MFSKIIAYLKLINTITVKDLKFPTGKASHKQASANLMIKVYTLVLKLKV